MDRSGADAWFFSGWPEAGYVALSTAAIFLAVIGYVRLAGLRSFAKMSSFDFAMTVAVGSLMATTASSTSTTVVNGVLALGVFFGVQVGIGLLRSRVPLNRWIDNSPVVLMIGTEFVEANLRQTRVTHDDLRAKLREANAIDETKLRAVVLETTGNVSVLYGDVDVPPRLLEGVVGFDQAGG